MYSVGGWWIPEQGALGNDSDKAKPKYSERCCPGAISSTPYPKGSAWVRTRPSRETTNAYLERATLYFYDIIILVVSNIKTLNFKLNYGCLETLTEHLSPWSVFHCCQWLKNSSFILFTFIYYSVYLCFSLTCLIGCWVNTRGGIKIHVAITHKSSRTVQISAW
jgi:hypothetical protein